MVTKTIINSAIGSLELTPENGYNVQTISNIGYGTKYSISDILSKHGVKLGNALFKNKVFSIGIVIVGTSVVDLIEKRALLYKYLTVDNYSNDDKIQFEFVMANGQSLLLSGILKDLTDDLTTDQINASPINFVIETEYPFLVSKQQYQIRIPIATGGGGAVPMTIPLDMSAGAANYTPISNGGNVFAYSTMRFTGLLTNPVILDVLKSKSLALAATISGGAYYDIDTYQRTVLDNVGNNKLDKLTGEFLVINPGENRFKLSTDNAGDTGYVDVTYAYHYVSI